MRHTAKTTTGEVLTAHIRHIEDDAVQLDINLMLDDIDIERHAWAEAEDHDLVLVGEGRPWWEDLL